MPDEWVRVTVNVPGKKPLTVQLRGLPGGMALSNEGGSQNPKDAILVKNVRAIRFEDERR